MKAACFALFAACLTIPAPTEANQTDPNVLDMARTVVAECGWDSTEDQVAVIHVLRRRARRAGMEDWQMARAYSAAWKTKKRPWTLQLRADMKAPRSWPSEAAWANYRQRWAKVIELVKDTPEDPCEGQALHFGDQHGDRARARRAGWRKLSCGRLNDYWALR